MYTLINSYEMRKKYIDLYELIGVSFMARQP